MMTVYEKDVRMTVHEQEVRMRVYEQVMMTAYEEIFRIYAVPVSCNARSNTDNPAFNPGSGKRLVLFSKPRKSDLGHKGGRVGPFLGIKRPERDHSTPPTPNIFTV
jgi:hypothetical protein